jgi:hypothetical protein
MTDRCTVSHCTSRIQEKELQEELSCTYQCHSFLVPILPGHVLSGRRRGERIKERSRKELTSPDRRGFGFLVPL